MNAEVAEVAEVAQNTQKETFQEFFCVFCVASATSAFRNGLKHPQPNRSPPQRQKTQKGFPHRHAPAAAYPAGS
ncbi:hypothetical protein [Ramlibacter sp.]|uniref:hypothetical protein n=1 Tax=Ramlibacter sp. TaxID=1917967 RepID=UPI00261C27CD|nr:hypothetical protein [Ramlibacter sp.]